MNIGIDIDDVLADFIGGWLPFYNKRHNLKLKPKDIFSHDLHSVLNITREKVVNRIYDFYNSPQFDELIPIDGTVENVCKLKKEHNLIVITSRPNITKQKSVRWLKKHYGNNFNRIIFTDQFGKRSHTTQLSKTNICLKYDISLLIEDAPKYCFDAAESGINVFMINRPWNFKTQLAKNMHRVSNWNEIEERVRKLDS